jgi:formylglycine-generating enzyme
MRLVWIAAPVVGVAACGSEPREEPADGGVDTGMDAGVPPVAFCERSTGCSACAGGDQLDCSRCGPNRVFCARVPRGATCDEVAEEVDCPDETIYPTRPDAGSQDPEDCHQVDAGCITEGAGDQICIPGGIFVMGDDDDPNASPARAVYVTPFWMDRLPVTVGRYRQCVAEGWCLMPASPSPLDDEDDDKPMQNVRAGEMSWFCLWMRSRLPTETEWERAARGDDLRTYPWGEETGCEYAAWGDCVTAHTSVDGYPLGASPYGLLDMIGNLPELTSDGWVEGGYDGYWWPPRVCDPVATAHDGVGAEGKSLVRRGCDIHGDMETCTVFHRSRTTTSATSGGWRCARDGVPGGHDHHGF